MFRLQSQTSKLSMERESNKNGLEIHLRDKIIAKILLLLPFESVLACKRLSKQWKDFINHKNFAKNYRHNGSMILLLEGNDIYCVLSRHNNEVTHTVHRIPISLNQPKFESSNGKILKHELLSGWSDGIACVKASNGHFVLYNLFTGASHTVEDAPLQQHSGYWICYGFGYDRIDDDYKIMVACDYKARFDTDDVENKENGRFWVYSHGNRCWRSYDGFPYVEPPYIRPQFSPCGGYYSNGVLHYAIVKRGRKPVIVTYDLHTRRFGEILAPVCDFGYAWAKVFELDGRLCYGYDYYRRVVEVRDAGGSWTKLFIFDSLNLAYYTALYEWGGGRRVALVCGGRLIWYDFRKNEIEEVDVPSMWQIKRMQLRLIKRIERILGMMMQVQQNVVTERGHWQQMMQIQQNLMKEREHIQQMMQMQQRQLKPREHRQRMRQIQQNLKKKRELMQEVKCGKFNKASVWII